MNRRHPTDLRNPWIELAEQNLGYLCQRWKSRPWERYAAALCLATPEQREAVYVRAAECDAAGTASWFGLSAAGLRHLFYYMYQATGLTMEQAAWGLATAQAHGVVFDDVAVPTVVYRHFGDDGRLLYVGIAARYRYFERTQQHVWGALWWQSVRSTVIETHHSRRAALAVEARAIRDERPIYNILGQA